LCGIPPRDGISVTLSGYVSAGGGGGWTTSGAEVSTSFIFIEANLMDQYHTDSYQDEVFYPLYKNVFFYVWPLRHQILFTNRKGLLVLVIKINILVTSIALHYSISQATVFL